MTITTRGGKQTIDPPMPSNEEKVRKDNDKVVEGSGEAEDRTGKDAEVPIKVFHMPRPPPPFPQRLVKKTEPFGRGSRTNAWLFQVYERSCYKEKISHFRG